jgi:hypothetical protein
MITDCEEEGLTLKFTANAEGGYNVHGSGKNSLGMYRVIGCIGRDFHLCLAILVLGQRPNR